jgi:threonine synthase
MIHNHRPILCSLTKTFLIVCFFYINISAANMSSVTYSSTRGGQKSLDFRSVVMIGLAHDRGLFVPDTIPTVSKDELESWRNLSYPDLATKVLSKFVQEDQVPAEKLADIVKRSCAAFRHEDVTPVVQVGGHAILVSLNDSLFGPSRCCLVSAFVEI